MPAVLELRGISKAYGGLRPLRLESFTLEYGERAALVGPDQPAAETLTNLITGATLPDAGDIRVFGVPTANLATSDEWLAFVDRFGIVSERAVLLESLSALQNLAMPFSLDIEPPPPEIRARASALAEEVGLPTSVLETAVAQLSGADRFRLRLGRALALGPELLLLEHPTASVEPAAIGPLAASTSSVANSRRLAAMAVTLDEHFAEEFATRIEKLDGATGRTRAARRGWFTRRRK